jgi:hypothetical protein
VIARQPASEMKKKITKQPMALLMKTSRAQVDRLLDPDNGSATIESLQRAARIVGRGLRLQCRPRQPNIKLGRATLPSLHFAKTVPTTGGPSSRDER